MRIDRAAMFNDSTGYSGNDLISIMNRKFPDIDFYSVEKVNVNAGELHDIPFAQVDFGCVNSPSLISEKDILRGNIFFTEKDIIPTPRATIRRKGTSVNSQKV